MENKTATNKISPKKNYFGLVFIALDIILIISILIITTNIKDRTDKFNYFSGLMSEYYNPLSDNTLSYKGVYKGELVSKKRLEGFNYELTIKREDGTLVSFNVEDNLAKVYFQTCPIDGACENFITYLKTNKEYTSLIMLRPNDKLLIFFDGSVNLSNKTQGVNYIIYGSRHAVKTIIK